MFEGKWSHELRDRVLPHYTNPTLHLWSQRLGAMARQQDGCSLCFDTLQWSQQGPTCPTAQLFFPLFSISWSNKSNYFPLRNLDQFTVTQPPQGAVRAKREQKVVAEAPQSRHNAIAWEWAARLQHRRQQSLGCAWWDCMALCVAGLWHTAAMVVQPHEEAETHWPSLGLGRHLLSVLPLRLWSVGVLF